MNIVYTYGCMEERVEGFMRFNKKFKQTQIASKSFTVFNWKVGKLNFVICHNHLQITMENNTDHSDQNNFSPLTVQEVDVDFLPIVYEIIRRYKVCCHLFID